MIPVYVAHVKTPSCFTVQLIGEKTTKALEYLQEDLTQFYSGPETDKYRIDTPFIGQVHVHVLDNVLLLLWLRWQGSIQEMRYLCHPHPFDNCFDSRDMTITSPPSQYYAHTHAHTHTHRRVAQCSTMTVRGIVPKFVSSLNLMW